MAESTTLTADSSVGLHKVAALATPVNTAVSRIRFQRAKPNLSCVAGRRPGLAATSTISAAAATPQHLSRVVPSPQPPVPSTPPIVVAARTIEPDEGHLCTPPPIQRVTASQPSDDQTRSPDVPFDTPDAPCSTEVAVASEGKDQLTTIANAGAVPRASNDGQTTRAVADVFVKPTATVHAPKRRERKGSTRDADKELVSRKRPKKIILEKPEKNKMTMFDFIHWNPSSNPMVYDEEESMVPLADKQTNVDEPSAISQRLAEENVDDLDNGDQPTSERSENVSEQAPSAAAANSAASSAEGEAGNDETMPVPRVKIGPDGSIILDEQSLVIETTVSKTTLSNSPAVYEHSSNTTYSSFRKKQASKNWQEKETAKFYMALSSVGTDFSLMQNFFPKRTRHELKLKFKREERMNRPLVEKAINDRQQFDLSLIGDDEDEENELDSSIDKAKSNCRRRYVKTGKKRGRKPKTVATLDNRTDGASCDDANANEAVTKVPRKRKYKRRGTLQIESDSDETVVEDIPEVEEGDNGDFQPPKRRKKNCLKNKEKTTANVSAENADVNSTSVDEAIGQLPVSDQVDPLETTTKIHLVSNDEGANTDEESDEVVESLLQKTRSGRQPKKNSVFTIDVTQTKRRARRKAATLCVNATEPVLTPLRTLSPRATAAAAADSNPLILTPNQLILLAEKPGGCGSQVIHLLMYSPSAPHVAGEVSSLDPTLPGLVEHDYASESLETPSGDSVELQAAISHLTDTADDSTGVSSCITATATVSC